MDGFVERPFLLYVALLLLTAVLPTARGRALGAAGLLLAALGMAADSVGSSAPGATFATVNAILIGSGPVIVLLAALRAWRERGDGGGAAPVSATALSLDLLLIAGLLLAGLGPHLILLAAGTFLVLVSAAASALRERRPRWIALVVVVAVLLGAGFFLLFTILGPEDGRLSRLAAGPFSPPAERLLTLLLGLGSLGISGVFPFHRAPWRLGPSPLAMILVVRVLVPALPEGLADWQAPAMLWGAVAAAAAAFSGRWAGAMVAGGLLGLCSGRPEGVAPAIALLASGWLADMGLLPFRGRAAAGRERWAGLWFVIAGLGIPLVLGAGLRAQVLVTVLAALSVAGGLLFVSGRRSLTG